jgi:hypothetical protein
MIKNNRSATSRSVELLDNVRIKNNASGPILEVITDHGLEFINTRQDE